MLITKSIENISLIYSTFSSHKEIVSCTYDYINNSIDTLEIFNQGRNTLKQIKFNKGHLPQITSIMEASTYKFTINFSKEKLIIVYENKILEDGVSKKSYVLKPLIENNNIKELFVETKEEILIRNMKCKTKLKNNDLDAKEWMLILKMYEKIKEIKVNEKNIVLNLEYIKDILSLERALSREIIEHYLEKSKYKKYVLKK